ASDLTTAPTHALKPDPTSLGRSTSLIRGIRGQTSDGNQPNGATDPQADTPEPVSTPLTGPAGTLTIPGPAAVINRRSSLHEPLLARPPLSGRGQAATYRWLRRTCCVVTTGM